MHFTKVTNIERYSSKCKINVKQYFKQAKWYRLYNMVYRQKYFRPWILYFT